MPDQLTSDAMLDAPEPSGRAISPLRIEWNRATVLFALAAAGLFVLGGIVAGLVQHWRWSPPDGMVTQHSWYRGLISLDPLTLAQNVDQGVFDGLGWYIASCAVVGLVLGLVVALLLVRSELLSVAAVVLGGLAGGVVARLIAVALAPADPTPLAKSASDGTVLPDTLHLGSWWTIVVLPGTGLLALTALFLLITPRRARHL
ncbi:MAG: hypothetical protein QM638_18885 [Nocardioides sp.]|uniref:hypothetical protein n=1 Tax=Nocardioides sp. TaxID=35761 RepID=UPI0039E67000